VREFAKIMHPDLDKYFLYAENADRMRVRMAQQQLQPRVTNGGSQMGEDEVITTSNNIIKFTTAVITEKDEKKEEKKEAKSDKDKDKNKDKEEKKEKNLEKKKEKERGSYGGGGKR